MQAGRFQRAFESRLKDTLLAMTAEVAKDLDAAEPAKADLSLKSGGGTPAAPAGPEPAFRLGPLVEKALSEAGFK